MIPFRKIVQSEKTEDIVDTTHKTVALAAYLLSVRSSRLGCSYDRVLKQQTIVATRDLD